MWEWNGVVDVGCVVHIMSRMIARLQMSNERYKLNITTGQKEMLLENAQQAKKRIPTKSRDFSEHSECQDNHNGIISRTTPSTHIGFSFV